MRSYSKLYIQDVAIGPSTPLSGNYLIAAIGDTVEFSIHDPANVAMAYVDLFGEVLIPA